jgi:hypothetical protein
MRRAHARAPAPSARRGHRVPRDGCHGLQPHRHHNGLRHPQLEACCPAVRLGRASHLTALCEARAHPAAAAWRGRGALSAALARARGVRATAPVLAVRTRQGAARIGSENWTLSETNQRIQTLCAGLTHLRSRQHSCTVRQQDSPPSLPQAALISRRPPAGRLGVSLSVRSILRGQIPSSLGAPGLPAVNYSRRPRATWLPVHLQHLL